MKRFSNHDSSFFTHDKQRLMDKTFTTLSSCENGKIYSNRHKEDTRRTIMNGSPDAIVCTDRKGNISFWNKRAEQMFGYIAEDVIGQNLCRLIIPHEFQRDFNFTEMTAPPLNTLTEIRTVTSAGEILPAEISVMLLAEGNEEFYCAYIRDNTQRHYHRELLNSSLRRYQNLFRLIPASVFIWELATGKIVKVNAGAENDFGFSADEFYAMTIRDLKQPDTCCSSCSASALHPQENGQSYIGTRHHLTKNGKEIWLDYSSHAITFKGISCVMSLGINVTEEEELRLSLKDERIRKTKEIANAVITAQENERQEIGRELHDNINQLLASSRLYLGVVRKEINFSHPKLEEADRLLTKTITEIRNLSHSLVLPALQKEDFMKGLDDILEVAGSGSDLSVMKDISDLEESLVSDKLWLTIFRIVQEQFANILKHANAKKVVLKISSQNGHVTLLIADNGCGFNPEHRGGGVGLINIATRACLSNGVATVTSSPGKGCEMKVVFKVC